MRTVNSGIKWLSQNSPRLLLACVIILLVLPPLVVIIWASFSPPSQLGLGTSFTTENYRTLFETPGLAQILLRTVIFAVGSSMIAMIGGIATAYLSENTNVGLSRVALASALVTLAVPVLVRAFGWIYLLSPVGGILNSFILGGKAGALGSANIQSMAGMTIVQGLFWVPIVFLLVRGPLMNFDSSLDESAAICGAPVSSRLARVWLPSLTPVIASALLLVFIQMLQAFEVPLILGIPGGATVLSSLIYTDLNQGYTPAYGQISAFAVILVLAIFVLLAAYIRLTARQERFQLVRGRGQTRRRTELGWFGQTSGRIFIVLLLIVELLPVVSVVLVSFERVVGNPRSGFTVSHFTALFSYPGLTSGIMNSLETAAASATCCLILAFLVARLSVTRGRLAAAVDYLANLPLVYPGLVLSLALLILFLPLHVPIYGTILIYILGFTIAFTPLTLRYVHPSILQIHSELEEVAYVLGAGRLVVARRIVAPIVRTSLVSAWLLVFFISCQDIAIVSLTYTTSTPLISTTLLSMYSTGEFSYLMPFSALIGTSLIVMTSVTVFVLRHVTKSRTRNMPELREQDAWDTVTRPLEPSVESMRDLGGAT